MLSHFYMIYNKKNDGGGGGGEGRGEIDQTHNFLHKKVCEPFQKNSWVPYTDKYLTFIQSSTFEMFLLISLALISYVFKDKLCPNGPDQKV